MSRTKAVRFFEGRLLEEGCVGHLAAFGVEHLDGLVEVLFDQFRVQQPVATEGRVGAGIELGQATVQFGRIEVRFERESATKAFLLLFEPFHPRVDVLRIGFEIELYGGVLAVPFAVGAFKLGGVRFEYRVHVEVVYAACGLLDLTAETLRIRSDTNDDRTGAMLASHRQPPERKTEIETPTGMWGFVQNQVMWNFVNMRSKFSAVPSFSRRGGSLSAPGGSSGCGLAFLPPYFAVITVFIMLRTSTATIVFESHPSHGSTVGLSVLDSSDVVGGSSSNIRALYRLSGIAISPAVRRSARVGFSLAPVMSRP